MALQTFTAGQVLTAAQVTALQTNGFNQSVSTKTADHTLVAADKGTRVEMNSASATTITVDTDLFNAGDTLFIQNRGAGVCTITAGTATVSTSGSLALAEFQGGTLYFVSAGVAIFFLTGSAGGVSALKDADISGTTGSPTTATYTDGGINFKAYSFTGSGSITFTKSGLIDVLAVAGGGSCSVATFGGGAGGLISATNFNVPASAITVTIGAGGTGASGSSGTQGGHSIFNKLFAIGGGIGTNDGSTAGFMTIGASRGCSGFSGRPFVPGQGNDAFVSQSGGGGGGAGGAGGASAGGLGVSSTIRAGLSVTFSTGGSKTGGAGSANTGNGASATSGSTSGGSGIVVVRVLA